MKGMAAGMFRKKLKGFGMEDPIGMLRDAVKGGKMKLIPCQMTMDLMGLKGKTSGLRVRTRWRGCLPRNVRRRRPHSYVINSLLFFVFFGFV